MKSIADHTARAVQSAKSAVQCSAAHSEVSVCHLILREMVIFKYCANMSPNQ